MEFFHFLFKSMFFKLCKFLLSIKIVPDVGLVNPIKRSKSVDLPEPVLPIKPILSPFLIFRLYFLQYITIIFIVLKRNPSLNEMEFNKATYLI